MPIPWRLCFVVLGFVTGGFSSLSPLKLKAQDTASLSPKVLPPLPDPAKVTRRAFVPGWGQWTNRAYWKIPVVWGGLGFMAYQTRTTANLYLEYRNAYRWRTDNDPTTVDSYVGTDTEASLLQKRDLLRRSRDAYVLLSLAAYGLQILDAHVDAHLKAFDRMDFSLQTPPLGPSERGMALSMVYRF